MSLISRFAAIAVCCLFSSTVIAQDRAVIEAGKAAVALIEAGEKKVASAFCIDPLGVFVTNSHVVEELGLGASVKLVMQSSEADEWSLTAEVVLINTDADLAVLKAYRVPSDKKLTALPLAQNPNLYETMNLIAFGFPFGKQLTVKKDANPSISVNVGKLTAIRKENGKVELIQLDATLNPGNSGGPVVDESGKVVGIVSFGVLASGVNFAIPAEKLWPMLESPFYSLEASGLLLDPYIPSDVRVGFISMQREVSDLSVEIWCIGDQGNKKIIPLKSIGNNQFQGVVSVSQDDPKKIPLRVKFVLKEGEIVGAIPNEQIQLNNKSYWLSSITSVRQSEDGKSSSILLQDGNALTSDTTKLPQIKVDCGEVPAVIPLSKVIFAEVNPGKRENFIFNLVAKSKDKIIIQAVVDQNMSQAADVFARVDAGTESDSSSSGVIDSLNVDLSADSNRLRQRPKYTGKEKTIALPSAMTDVVRAGGGRFLLVSMKDIPGVAIIDLDQAEMVKVLPLPSADSLVAGTLEHFFIADPIRNVIQRYSLSRLELESTVPSPWDGAIVSMAAGEASDGPLMMHCVTPKDGFWMSNWVFIDPFKLTLIPVEIEKNQAHRIKITHSSIVRPQICASASGNVFGAAGFGGSPTGVLVAKLSDRFLTVRYEHDSLGYVVPSADGTYLFTNLGGALDQTLAKAEPPSRPVPALFPTSHPKIYLSIPPSKSEDPRIQQRSRSYVKMIGAEAPLATLPPIDLEVADPSGRPTGPHLDRRVYLDVEAGILATIPLANNKVIVQPFDLQAELKKSAADYLVATAPKNTRITLGGIYQSQIRVETNRPNIGYRLLSGPKGMEISPAGALLWKVPRLLKKPSVDVIVSITSNGVHQTFVTFSLSNLKGQ